MQYPVFCWLLCVMFCVPTVFYVVFGQIRENLVMEKDIWALSLLCTVLMFGF